METLRRGRLGLLRRTSFGSYANLLDMYTQVREEEQIISPPYTRIQQDVSMRGRKKRKQGEDNALIGLPPCCVCCMARLLVAWCYVRVLFPPGGERFWSPRLMAYLLEEGQCSVCLPVFGTGVLVAETLEGPNRLARISRVCIAIAWETALMYCWSSVGRKV